MAGRVPKGRFARGSRLGRLAAGQAVRGVGTRLSMVGRTEQARQVLAERSALQTAQQIVTVLGSMKGAAMKLGQMLSVLDIEMVPESHRELFRLKLAELRDHAPAVSFAQMRKVIEDDLGPLARAFADFDETPVAAASIGQVYRARLHDGRAVAVKAQYPGVDEAIAADMRNLEFFSTMWKSILPSAADAAVLDEITRNLERELDYPREARTQHRVAARYRDHPFITVPDSVEELCTRHVLVTELVEGRQFQQIRELPEAERDRIGELIYRFYVSSLFADHEFCGDPHPGNILLADDGRVGFVDFGLYNRMDPVHVDFERMCMRFAGEQRAEDLYDAWVGRGIIAPDAGVSPRECLEYVWAAAGWHLLDEPITITPELATGAVVLAVDPRASEFKGMRHQLLPPEHVFSRRADLFTYAALGQLGSTNNWHRIAREWLYDEPPVTEIGLATAQWLSR
ncbi:AarF/ABC1/UbiB kinase family protein [Nocardia cyriacigeorgica]|uniref:ABC1 kinase family protein n=1 Tax=Nocardia cyriacigeorgica TaxID=135487 RepID=UPI0013B8FB42|nr:AarF/ABC1/UbiB kinase family protein [Nocardia cyriacigeorgica]NEW53011.1 AarF/ABC1/UbiB kinase family protein [Nocardia cyriacigeorgica]